MTDGKIITPILGSRGAPAGIAEKALTAEAAWRDAEAPSAEAKTAAGTDPALNAATYLEDSNRSALHETEYVTLWPTSKK